MGKKILIYLLRTIFLTFAPMVTYLILCQRLSVEILGKFNYNINIVEYFNLLAEFGFSTYAVRQLSGYKKDGQELKEKGSDMLSANVFTASVSYVFFLLLVFANKNMDKKILYLLSFIIIFKGFSMEWMLTIKEEYTYLLTRTIIVQIVFIANVIALIKTDRNLYLYVALYSIQVMAISILNWIKIKKNVDIHLRINRNVILNIKHAFVFFLSNFLINIYVNSDITMLGILGNDRFVGLYSYAAKIYAIIKNILLAIIMSLIPRLYYSHKQEKKEYVRILRVIFQYCILVVTPFSFILAGMRNEIINITSFGKYIESVDAFEILLIAMPVSIIAYVMAYCVLVPRGDQKFILFATFVAAMTNIFLNFVMIPQWNIRATAATTLVSESVVLGIYILKIKIYKRSYKKYACILISEIIFILGMCHGVDILIWNIYLRMIVKCIMGIFVLGINVLFFSTEMMDEFKKIIKNLIFSRKVKQSSYEKINVINKN